MNYVKVFLSEYKVGNIQIQLKNGIDFKTLMSEKLNYLGEEGWKLLKLISSKRYFH
ncbi:hypothetical protein [Bacillus niameyensis]|uniref:hypothetical protein n=1 Tax=Bacillus niameyensis TaxID=1522308 RepID=UPI000AB3CD2C|nr:hypothetical protein [Bacillus niameyensis]